MYIVTVLLLYCYYTVSTLLLYCYCIFTVFLRPADHSSRGVITTVVRHFVWSRNLKNEETMTRVGSQRHRKKLLLYCYYIVTILLLYCYCIFTVFLRLADHSSRGVITTVVCHFVWSRNLKNEETMTRVGSQRHRKKIVTVLLLYCYYIITVLLLYC